MLKDSTLHVLPVSHDRIKQGLLSLRAAKIFAGARGTEPADLDAVADVVSTGTTLRQAGLEIFGPVLTVQAFDTDDEAIALANDTVYGLAASAWTTDVYRAGRASREIQAGCVWVNDHIPIISEMPHGGYKQSGFGKDMSHYSFEEYTQVKHVMSDITGAARKEWHRTIFRGA